MIIMLLPLMLAVGCKHKTETPAEGSLYERYASLPETSVAQVCDFQLCDTVSVDVVLLQVEDDEAWQQMAEEFAIADTTGVISWLGDIDEPALRTTWDGQPVLRVIASPETRAIGLYRLENEEQYDALIDYQLNKLKN